MSNQVTSSDKVQIDRVLDILDELAARATWPLPPNAAARRRRVGPAKPFFAVAIDDTDLPAVAITPVWGLTYGVLVSRGALTLLSDSQLRAFLAHEVAHAELRHFIRGRWSNRWTRRRQEMAADRRAIDLSHDGPSLAVGLAKMETAIPKLTWRGQLKSHHPRTDKRLHAIARELL